jgi:hypothetical protein
MELINREKRLATAVAKARMSEKTARKYRRLSHLPSQCKAIHGWKTREDAFEGDWPWAEELLKNSTPDRERLFSCRGTDGARPAMAERKHGLASVRGCEGASREGIQTTPGLFAATGSAEGPRAAG